MTTNLPSAGLLSGNFDVRVAALAALARSRNADDTARITAVLEAIEPVVYENQRHVPIQIHSDADRDMLFIGCSCGEILILMLTVPSALIAAWNAHRAPE